MHKHSHDIVVYLIGALAVAGVATSVYLLVENQAKDEQIERQNQELETKDAELEAASSTITSLREEQTNLKEDLDDLADDYRDAREQNDEFEDQIRDLAGTIGDLDKLSKIDEELLAKYSKVYFLNENYRPERLREIDEDYILEGKDDEYFQAEAMEHLEDLMEAAEDDDIDLKIVSAYRSFDEQSELKGQFTQTYGTGANTFSADQGYSEHQLGTTIDLTTPEVGGAYESFAQTEAYEWLLDNAHEYGFILSYPEDNNFYVFEPWHWRFVGTELAEDLHDSDETFYTMEQREINEYLINFFD